MRRTALVSLFAIVMFAGSARAADENGPSGQVPMAPVAVSSLATVASGLTQYFDVNAAAVATPRSSVMERPAILTSLYVGSAVLQGFDAYSTLKVLNAGGAEANPMMRGVTQNPAAFIAVKAGITAATIMASEKMWKNHNRAGAVMTMVASNVLMGIVAANNSRVMSEVR